MSFWRHVLGLRRHQAFSAAVRRMQEAADPFRPLRELMERQAYASLGMTRLDMTFEEYQALSPEDRRLLFGSPKPPVPAELPPPPDPPVQPPPADPEPRPDASVPEHDAWLLRGLDRERPNWREQVEDYSLSLGQLAKELEPRARTKSATRKPRTIRDRLVRKLRAPYQQWRSARPRR